MTIEGAKRTMLAGVLLAVAAPAWAQNSGVMQRAQLLENQAKLHVTLTLDRQAYLPGELAELTISIVNPTTQGLEIPQPFSQGTGALMLLEKDRRTREGVVPGYTPALLEPDEMQHLPGYEPPPLPSVHIEAGGSIVKQFRSWDPAKGNWGWLIYRGSAPTWAGEFRLEYWGGQVDFRVMSPSFEGMTRILLPEWEDVLVGVHGEMERRQRRTFAFVLEAEGEHYVCVFNHAVPYDPDPVRRFRTGPVRRADMEQLTAFQRIGESKLPLPTVAAESDGDGTITVSWGAKGEGERRLRQDEWRLPVSSASGGKE
jgi:hypothetical protein